MKGEQRRGSRGWQGRRAGGWLGARSSALPAGTVFPRRRRWRSPRWAAGGWRATRAYRLGTPTPTEPPTPTPSPPRFRSLEPGAAGRKAVRFSVETGNSSQPLSSSLYRRLAQSVPRAGAGAPLRSRPLPFACRRARRAPATAESPGAAPACARPAAPGADPRPVPGAPGAPATPPPRAGPGRAGRLMQGGG